jgi:hypothetical protein
MLLLLLQVEVAKQLMAQQLQAQSAETSALAEQLEILRAELEASRQASAARASAASSASATPTGMAPALLSRPFVDGSTGKQGGLQKKPSLAARIKASFSHKHIAAGAPDAAAAAATAAAAADPAASASTVVAESGVGSTSREGAGALHHAALDLPAQAQSVSANGAADGTQQQELSSEIFTLGVGPAATLFSISAAPSLTGKDDRLATASRAVPGVQELVQHYEVVATMERTSSCSNSVCSAVSELQRTESLPKSSSRAAAAGDAPSATASPRRPTPLPRVASLSQTNSTAASPKGAASPKVPVSPKASAFGRSVSSQLQTSSGSFTGRISGTASPKSPALSAAASGAPTSQCPQHMGDSGAAAAVLAAVSSRLHAAPAAGKPATTAAGAAPGRSRIPGVGVSLTRSGSASSAKSETVPSAPVGTAEAGAGAQAGNLKQQLSRLVPGGSNGGVGSERSGGGSAQGSIFKQKPAGSGGDIKTGSAKKPAAGSGPARKAK